MAVKFNFNRSIGWNLDMQRVEITQRIFDGPDCYSWREVFAFLPVKTVSGKYVWLQKVYKQRYWAVWGLNFHMEPHVEYATLFEVLANEN
jgi:hypothetical protein